MNAELAITLLLSLVDRAAAISALLAQAKAQGRDISAIELDTLCKEDDAARAALVAAIARARNPAP